MPCKYCNGAVLQDYDELKCVNCGREHDLHGNLITPKENTKLKGGGRK